MERVHSIAFMQELANKLNVGPYSLKEIFKLHHYDYYRPDGIIFKEEQPFVIVEIKEYFQQTPVDDTFRRLSYIQQYLKIPWAIYIQGEYIYLRRIDEHFASYGDINETVRAIKESIVNNVSELRTTDYLNEILSIINKYTDRINRKDEIRNFIKNLNSNDITKAQTGICFTEEKERDFFESILSPVENDYLYRYSSQNSLFKLLEGHKQNMLSLNCMNDMSEIDYTDEYINITPTTLHQSVIEANKVFILSCCDESKADDLMMWRLYANNAEGVSLGYYIKKRKIDNDYFYLAKVSYGQDKNSHAELDLIREMLSWKLRGHRFFFNKWLVWKHFFKSYHFHYEKEIRLVYFEHENSIADETLWIEDNKNGIASPMKLFDLKTSNHTQFPLSLVKVILGPRSKENNINLVQYSEMYNEAKIYCPGIRPEFSNSEINIYR